MGAYLSGPFDMKPNPQRKSRLAPSIIPPDLQNPEICKAKQSRCFQDKDFPHYEDSFSINKTWKNIKEEGMSTNHRIVFVM